MDLKCYAWSHPRFPDFFVTFRILSPWRIRRLTKNRESDVVHGWACGEQPTICNGCSLTHAVTARNNLSSTINRVNENSFLHGSRTLLAVTLFPSRPCLRLTTAVRKERAQDPAITKMHPIKIETFMSDSCRGFNRMHLVCWSWELPDTHWLSLDSRIE
jgi:hypothetical protein